MIDLDTFNPATYFPAKTSGHCVPIALALHRLTSWPLFRFQVRHEWMAGFIQGIEWMEEIPGYARHAVVQSPLGYLDLYGPRAEVWFAEDLGLDSPDEVEAVPQTARELELDYLTRDDFDNALTYCDESEDPRPNFELAVPVAQVVLARWFPERWDGKQLSLF